MPKKVIQEPTYLSNTSKEIFQHIDFADTFSTTNHKNNLEEITNLIFNNPPKWVSYLMQLRNNIVKHIGLKTAKPEDYHEKFEEGGYIYFFKIYSISESEVIIGADDSHLNFRAVILNTKSEKYNIKMITLVKYNNAFGKFYMSLIAPFHRLAVKSMVKKAYY